MGPPSLSSSLSNLYFPDIQNVRFPEENNVPLRQWDQGKESSQGTRKRTGARVVTSRNAARERTRVKSLRNAFQNLQRSLPYVPPNTKLSKLDVLILATTYISHLMRLLSQDDVMQNDTDYTLGATSSGLFQQTVNSDKIRSPTWESSYLHPVKKWPMRSRLYAGVESSGPSTLSACSSLPYPEYHNVRWKGCPM